MRVLADAEDALVKVPQSPRELREERQREWRSLSIASLSKPTRLLKRKGGGSPFHGTPIEATVPKVVSDASGNPVAESV